MTWHTTISDNFFIYQNAFLKYLKPFKSLLRESQLKKLRKFSVEAVLFC